MKNLYSKYVRKQYFGGYTHFTRSQNNTKYDKNRKVESVAKS